MVGPSDKLLVPSLVAAARAGKSNVTYYIFSQSEINSHIHLC